MLTENANNCSNHELSSATLKLDSRNNSVITETCQKSYEETPTFRTACDLSCSSQSTDSDNMKLLVELDQRDPTVRLLQQRKIAPTAATHHKIVKPSPVYEDDREVFQLMLSFFAEVFTPLLEAEMN